MNRIEREKNVVAWMIELYCRKHHDSNVLCDDCRELVGYSKKKLTFCKFGNEKTTCKKCVIHCYSPEMRERIRTVMRYSGPRLMWHHPIAVIQHLLQ